jgi:hypothetical protein
VNEKSPPSGLSGGSHSVYVGVFDKKDVSAFIKKSKDLGDSLLHFAGYVKHATSF